MLVHIFQKEEIRKRKKEKKIDHLHFLILMSKRNWYIS
jgi:hypothetical protein